MTRDRITTRWPGQPGAVRCDRVRLTALTVFLRKTLRGCEWVARYSGGSVRSGVADNQRAAMRAATYGG